MTAESIQPVRIGSGDQGLAKSRRHLFRPPIRIQETLVKMADLDCVETIDFIEKTRPDGTPKDIKWMRRNRKDRHPAPGAQLAQIVKTFEGRDFAGSYIQNDHIRATYSDFRRRNKQNAHRRCVSENFWSIKHGVVQRDRKNAEAERLRALKQLVSGIIDDIFGIIERVNVQIDLDPIAIAIIIAQDRHLPQT